MARETEKEGQDHSSILSEQHRLQSVVQAEVEASVDDDTHTGYHKPALESDKTVASESLPVDVDYRVELS